MPSRPGPRHHGLPQLDIGACPEIITAQHRARTLLRRCTPEQLIYAQVQAGALATIEPTGQEPSPGWEKRTQLLRKTNPGLNFPGETELTRAARYPGIIAGSAAILAVGTATCLTRGADRSVPPAQPRDVVRS